MKQNQVNKKRAYILGLVALCVCLGVGFYQFNKQSNLDNYYLDRFKAIKSRMIYGSPDEQDELNNYHDQTEFCMYQDGYTGPEIMEIRIKAFKEALLERNQ